MSDPGPSLLEERTLLGIFVHLLGLVFGIFVALPLYLISDHDFTKENARHVLNWHLTVFGILIAALAWIIGVDFLGIPDGIAILLFIPLFLGFGYMAIGMMIFPLIGTIKAIFGTPWKYPLVPEFVERHDP